MFKLAFVIYRRAILNLFGVLTLKRQAEQFLAASGIPYTILRPSRLTDGPYTSYDLNTLLQARVFFVCLTAACLDTHRNIICLSISHHLYSVAC